MTYSHTATAPSSHPSFKRWHESENDSWMISRVISMACALAIPLFALVFLAKPSDIPTPARDIERVLSISIHPEPPPPPKVPDPPTLIPRPRTVAPNPVKRMTPPVVIPVLATTPVEITSDIPDILPVSSIDPPKGPVSTGPSGAGTLVLTYSPKPTYPLSSLRNKEEGTVTLRIQVMTDGSAGRIEIAQSSGYRTLDQAARSAAKRWRFKTRMENGVPVEDIGLVPIVFQIEKR